MTTTTKITASIPIHVEMRGDPSSPCVVLVQGLGMRIADWPKELVQAMEKDFFVVCVENRDIGQSGSCGPDIDPVVANALAQGETDGSSHPYSLFDMSEDVLAVLKHLRIEDFAVVGFSMGGMIAQLVAAGAPECVTAFAQVCSSAGEAEAPVPAEAMSRFLRTCQPFNSGKELVDWLAEDLIWSVVPTDFPVDEAWDTAIDMVENGFTQGGYTRQLAALLHSGDRTDHLRNISCPALVLGAQNDRCIRPESSYRASGLITGSKLVVVPGTGHALSPQVQQILCAWLRDTLVTEHSQHEIS